MPRTIHIDIDIIYEGIINDRRLSVSTDRLLPVPTDWLLSVSTGRCLPVPTDRLAGVDPKRLAGVDPWGLAGINPWRLVEVDPYPIRSVETWEESIWGDLALTCLYIRLDNMAWALPKRDIRHSQTWHPHSQMWHHVRTYALPTHRPGLVASR